MLKELKHISERYENYTAADYKKATAILLERQFLYGDKKRDREYYLTILRELDYFIDLFDALGWRLVNEPDFQCLGLLPDEEQSYLNLKLEETILLLCLRLLYEEAIKNFKVEQGLALESSESLLNRYETLTGRTRPTLSHFKDILTLFSRHGILDKGEETDKTIKITIRPAIRLVTPAAYLKRLEEFLENETTK
ncbi:hypothetical protein PN36_19340 [Candidatus Thiomargarita nelsonii]|uniref:DUF4194 domain-containing protein n=1 Tax=Candidatus Thiomargarita nelsonii TaxID=1003181 RepID=A0A4E0RH28_9GAMM|nr:hypothetical protein PN36_19340 [Candidatus Thiomargarita nelsonii]